MRLRCDSSRFSSDKCPANLVEITRMLSISQHDNRQPDKSIEQKASISACYLFLFCGTARASVDDHYRVVWTLRRRTLLIVLDGLSLADE